MDRFPRESLLVVMSTVCSAVFGWMFNPCDGNHSLPPARKNAIRNETVPERC